MTEPIIELEHVTVRYQELVALEDVSLKVLRTQFVALLGPNGSGKTTLIRTILGLVQPERGRVRLFGTPPARLGKERARIGYVPQLTSIDPRFPLRALDVVLMGRYPDLGLLRRPSEADREEALRALRRVDLERLAGRPIARLSGGQRQRVLIARALAGDPELLILDEPTSGVDVAATESLFELLADFHREGMTILVASHDIGVVAQYVDLVACLDRRLVAHGRPEEVLHGEVLECMYGPGAIILGHAELPHIVLGGHGRRQPGGH